MKQTIRISRLMLATGVLLALAGCATPGMYGTPNDGYGNPGAPAYSNQLQGSVDQVDTRYNRIYLIAKDPRSMRVERVEVRYDQRTQLRYQGREERVDGLERGDIIRVDVAQSGREIWAQSIELVRNVRDNGYGEAYGDGNDVHGTVAFVDTRAQLIQLDSTGYGTDLQLSYDARTTVEYQGRSYRPENLERGDSIRIQARNVGTNRWLAVRIIVERSTRR